MFEILLVSIHLFRSQLNTTWSFQIWTNFHFIEFSSMLVTENSYRIFIFLFWYIFRQRLWLCLESVDLKPIHQNLIRKQNNISNIRLKRLPDSQFAARNRNAQIWALIINLSLRKQNAFNQILIEWIFKLLSYVWIRLFSNDSGEKLGRLRHLKSPLKEMVSQSSDWIFLCFKWWKNKESLLWQCIQVRYQGLPLAEQVKVQRKGRYYKAFHRVLKPNVQ